MKIIYRGVKGCLVNGQVYDVIGYHNGDPVVSDGYLKVCLNVSKDYEIVESDLNTLMEKLVQANKDRMINGYTVVGEMIYCQTVQGDDQLLGVGDDVSKGIDFINSLYFEKFTIESVEGLRIEPNDIVTLSNGEKLTDELIKMLSRYEDDFIYPILKGATVERKK